ncbi:hypothetical protein PISL3812_07933 [Talaromyces islandicus]|uniref:Uncharacterized protein n=1 Tax=Talaromyces islandicus TaxID=28573 RepID=A0A0U1M5S8_TALIS|nr:hypothetical protein PISL3812_07933 [Talaromyces islandicus]
METDGYPLYPPPSYSAIAGRRNSTKSLHTHDSASLYADSASEATTFASIDKDFQTTFRPGRSLHIDARGIGPFRMPIPIPVPDLQMEISVFDCSNEDGLAYISRRSKLHSGDAVLLDALTGKELVATKYFFGPGKDPIMHVRSGQACVGNKNNVMDYKIQLSSKWTSRTMSFTMPACHKNSPCRYQWAYGKRRDPDTGSKSSLITLRQQPVNDTDPSGKTIAEFVRSTATRSVGSSRATAGNGGLLVIDRDAEEYLDQEVVVATCLVMLKRETDRRRVFQMAVV